MEGENGGSERCFEFKDKHKSQLKERKQAVEEGQVESAPTLVTMS